MKKLMERARSGQRSLLLAKTFLLEKTRSIQWTLLSAMTLLSFNSHAQLGGEMPTTPTPSSGESDNFLEIAQGWFADAITVIGFVLAAVVFIYVARNVMTAYADSVDGRGTLSGVFTQALVGVVIIGLVILLVTEATGIFT